MIAFAATMEQARRHSQPGCGSSAMSVIMGHALCACLFLFHLLVLVGLVALQLPGLVVVSIIILLCVLAGQSFTPAGNKA